MKRAALPAILLLAAAAGAFAAAPALRTGSPERPLVVIDAGHGGRDPGAQPPGVPVPEKALTLAIADALRDRLVQRGRVRVLMTREDDRTLGLTRRVRAAREQDASLFIAIHADSAPNPLARGATIYTLSEVASDAEAARFAARENRDVARGSDPLPSSRADVRAILADLTLRETMATSADFARLLQREAAGRGVPFRQTYHRFADFTVLRAADTPAVLFETGYLTNVEDLAFLLSDAGRARIVEGAARAIEIYAARRLRGRPATAG